MKRRFVGTTTARPEWWFPIEYGKVYNVCLRSKWNGITAIIRNEEGLTVCCPYSSIDTFFANWESLDEAARSVRRKKVCPYCGRELEG